MLLERTCLSVEAVGFMHESPVPPSAATLCLAQGVIHPETPAVKSDLALVGAERGLGISQSQEGGGPSGMKLEELPHLVL